jgi:hypothetical protein
MSLPIDDAMTIHAAIPGSQPDGQGGFVIPCNTTAQIALTFGGTSFSIDPRDLVLAPVDSNNPTGDCVSGISGGIFGGDTVWIVSSNQQFISRQNADCYPISSLATIFSRMSISRQTLTTIGCRWLDSFRGLVRFLYYRTVIYGVPQRPTNVLHYKHIIFDVQHCNHDYEALVYLHT